MDDKELLERQMRLIEDNVNVGKTSDGKNFFILVGGIIGVIFIIIMFANLFANIFINHMSKSSQLKIERMFGELPKDDYYKPEYKEQFVILQNIRKNIISKDKNLSGMSTFPIIITKNENLNAWVIPNGTIYFTTTLMDKHFSEEELAFVLAHEIGHYSHRDHLKTMSRQVIITVVCSVLTSQNTDLSSLVTNITNLEYLNHSRRQERKADLYANKMLIALYGTNKGGIDFFKYLEKEHKAPEFIQYFMSHPSPQKRLRLINK